MMKNILTLFLLLSSIGVEVFSQNLEKNKNSREEDVIVRETQRLVFIEYKTEMKPKNEFETQKTQTPLEVEKSGFSSVSSFVGDSDEKMKETSGSLLNLGNGIPCEKFKQVADKGLDKAKELAAYKLHLIESGAKGAKSAAIETGKRVEEGYEKVKEKTHDFKEAFDDAKESAAESIKRIPQKVQWENEAIGRAKEKILEKTHGFKEAFDDVKEGAAESFKKIPQRVADKAQWEKEVVGDAKERIVEKTHDLSEGIGAVKESVKEKMQDLSQEIGDVKDKTKRFIPQSIGKWKVLDKTYDTAEDTALKAKEMVSDKAQSMKETAERMPETISEGFDKAKEMVMSTMPESISKVNEQASEKAASHEEMREGLFSKAKDKVLEKADELKTSSKESIETATEVTKRFTKDFKDTFKKLETALKDDRTIHVKTTHFFKEASLNFTILCNKTFQSVYHASDESVNWFTGVVRLMGFTTAYGSCVWVTFVSSHVLSAALPRQQYGMVQSKIYPVYFRVMAYSLGFSVLGYLFSKDHGKSSSKLHGIDVMASIGLVLVNMLFLEPRATKAMFDIMKREKEEGRETEGEGSERQADGEVREEDIIQHQAQLERLNKRLKKLNTNSAFCNILTLMILTSHLSILSQSLYARC